MVTFVLLEADGWPLLSYQAITQWLMQLGHVIGKNRAPSARFMRLSLSPHVLPPLCFVRFCFYLFSCPRSPKPKRTQWSLRCFWWRSRIAHHGQHSFHSVKLEERKKAETQWQKGHPGRTERSPGPQIGLPSLLSPHLWAKLTHLCPLAVLWFIILDSIWVTNSVLQQNIYIFNSDTPCVSPIIIYTMCNLLLSS